MLLEFENVSGIKGRFRLENISFQLPAGYIMGLVGANGAGKTTLVNYIMNDKVKYSGTIRLNGYDIRENHSRTRQLIGFVSEDNQFFKDFSADENMKMRSIFYDNYNEEIYYQAMKEMSVAGGLNYGNMSRGERIKFQMAFAMGQGAILYLLDEATAGMDPVFRIDFYKMLQRLIADENTSVLMTSHIESEVSRKTDYVGIMEGGRMINYGESLDVMALEKGD